MLKTFKCLSIWIPLWNSFCRPILCSLQSLNVLLLMLGAVIARMWWLDAKVSTGFCNLSLTYIDVWNVNIHRDIRSTLKIKANWIYTKCTHPHPPAPKPPIKFTFKSVTNRTYREEIDWNVWKGVHIYIYILAYDKWHRQNVSRHFMRKRHNLRLYSTVHLLYWSFWKRARERKRATKKSISQTNGKLKWNGLKWKERKGKESNWIG